MEQTVCACANPRHKWSQTTTLRPSLLWLKLAILKWLKRFCPSTNSIDMLCQRMCVQNFYKIDPCVGLLPRSNTHTLTQINLFFVIPNYEDIARSSNYIHFTNLNCQHLHWREKFRERFRYWMRQTKENTSLIILNIKILESIFYLFSLVVI